MPIEAWIMLVVGCLVLYGGLIFGIIRAVKRKAEFDGLPKSNHASQPGR